MGHSMENSKSQKDFPKDEETEKGCQEKEKGEDQVKYYSSHHHLLSSQFQLSANDKFVCFNTALNKHPYKDDDIQPPKAV